MTWRSANADQSSYPVPRSMFGQVERAKEKLFTVPPNIGTPEVSLLQAKKNRRRAPAVSQHWHADKGRDGFRQPSGIVLHEPI